MIEKSRIFGIFFPRKWGENKVENEFEKIELCEKEGICELRIDGKKLKTLTSYDLKRGTDCANITFTLSIPISNLKTCEN